MHGDGSETVQVFGLDGAQNTSISEKMTNQTFLLNYAQHNIFFLKFR